MNREERANKYVQDALGEWKKNKQYGILRLMRKAYLAGAEDADSNPAWRMCEEELPSRRNNKSYVSNKVCVAYQFLGGEVTVDYGWYDYDEDKWVIGTMNTKTIDIIAWLPLPKVNLKSE